MYNPESTDAGGDVGAAYGVVTRNRASGGGVHMYNPESTDAGGDIGNAYGAVT